MTTALNERLTAFTKQGSIFRRRNGKRNSVKMNGAVGFLGAIITITDETPPDAVLCTYTDIPNGILELLADDATLFTNDAFLPIGDNINVLYTNPAINDEFIVVIGVGKGAVINQIAVVDVDNPGFVEAMAGDNESIAAVPPFRIIGVFMATYALVSLKARHAWVKKQ